MAKAHFHKNQRVYVKPVGTWALIERVVPHWTKGLDEPLRVHYDVGLGREFAAEELQAEEIHWRLASRRPRMAKPGGSSGLATNGNPLRTAPVTPSLALSRW